MSLKIKMLNLIISEKPSVSKLIALHLNDPNYEYLAVAGHISTLKHTLYDKTPWAKVELSAGVILRSKYEYRN